MFFIGNLFILAGIIGVHLLLYFLIQNEQKSLSFLWRVKWFVLIIFLFHALSGPDDFILLKLKSWTLAFSKEGVLKGAIMASKLVAMLMTTQIVRFSMSKKQFIDGMSALGLNRDSAEIIDTIIEVVNSDRKSRKKEKGKKNGNGSTIKATDVLFRGKVGNLPKKLLERLDFAAERFKDNPNANVATSALAVTLIRMVKIAPGLPLAPGHKNILLFPILVYGILKSNKPFAGAQIGAISGILHFSMGFGKYGPLGIIEFILLGGVMDLLLKLPVKKNNLYFLMFIGAIGGGVRISIEIILAELLDMPSAFYLIYAPYIISQIAFGTASGFLSKALLKEKT